MKYVQRAVARMLATEPKHCLALLIAGFVLWFSLLLSLVFPN